MNDNPEAHDEPFDGPEAARVTALLDELKESDPPPPGLVPDVMAQIYSIQRRGRGPGRTTRVWRRKC